MNHFLLTQKAEDFRLFKKIVELINNQVHNTIKGLRDIINIKASLNKGLSDILLSEFDNIVPIKREGVLTKKIPDPY
jgi:flagellar basal body P-ring protein FlgI